MFVEVYIHLGLKLLHLLLLLWLNRVFYVVIDDSTVLDNVNFDVIPQCSLFTLFRAIHDLFLKYPLNPHYLHLHLHHHHFVQYFHCHLHLSHYFPF